MLVSFFGHAMDLVKCLHILHYGLKARLRIQKIAVLVKNLKNRQDNKTRKFDSNLTGTD